MKGGQRQCGSRSPEDGLAETGTAILGTQNEENRRGRVC